ncbi:UNVERIFIED_ORG: hypothetical protein M2438_002636 [Methylobacterium sp. SuP10 SLI 274]|uniref:hypothetical protein n=1 Tax=Methylorubrum extorquens TaxID=408 RepID=UPI0020A1E51D|nr:hypothetical protein [Methylorubrum extorquens]MDF9863863.1 hypothetical protein [Methylorubrum pseudosasae]MDH6637461.1 hypothetical protein [Methylobacterium sp. SuP10 SLI 274]MDH6666641.1 hypothetical protein [Methylorubrum zatmanii]MCP1558551.1 hypothetical protein [Methylorubrum extorquens]MDF9792178.1 hypothetical protein [Methylorubrum extorquens]
MVSYKGRAFAPPQAEIARDDALALTDVTLSASLYLGIEVDGALILSEQTKI